MKYLIFAIMSAVILTGCNQRSSETSVAVGARNDYVVEKLFTVDGCTVYRFSDNYSRYFTNCGGSTQWTENCGKGCSRPNGVHGQ